MSTSTRTKYTFTYIYIYIYIYVCMYVLTEIVVHKPASRSAIVYTDVAGVRIAVEETVVAQLKRMYVCVCIYMYVCANMCVCVYI